VSLVLRAAKVMRMHGQMGAVPRARAHFRGDPGILGSIGKFIGGVAGIAGKLIPGPIGMVAGGVSSLLTGAGKPLNPSVNVASIYGARGFTAPQDPQFPQLPYPLTAPIMPLGRGNTTQGGTAGGTDWNSSARETSGTPCGRGYHYNKSGYYSQRYGWVAKGSVCVKNRKRNPLNPRAASRAMARLSSAKKAVKALNRISIREAGCGCK
jgi:hypothetical protein